MNIFARKKVKHMEIKDIISNKLLIESTIENIHLTDSVKRRRQVSRLKELIVDAQPTTTDDSDVVKAVYTILKNMLSLTMIRYGATTYVEWTGRPPEDLIKLGVNSDFTYNFTSAKLLDPIRMYNDIEQKAEGAAMQLLHFIFNVAAGIDLRNTLDSLENMGLEHINLSTKHADTESVKALERFADFVDEQNGKGSFAAALMYPLLNNHYGKKRKHAMFGYGSNTGKGLLLSVVNKLYVGAPVQMPVRPNERDVYSTGAWNKLIINKWIVILGDSSESDLSYDFMKNLYEQPQTLAGRNERTKEMFYGNVYIATNSQQQFFADKEIYTRVFFLSMFKDVDDALGLDTVEMIDGINRDSIVQFIIDNQELGREYWNNYSTPNAFFMDEEPEQLYHRFYDKYRGTAVPVRVVKQWLNNPKQYKKLMELVKEYHGTPTNVKIDGVSTRAIDLRDQTLQLPPRDTNVFHKSTKPAKTEG